MIISDFTREELAYFRNNCNFVNFEIDVFEGRSQGIPLETIAEKGCIYLMITQDTLAEK